MPWREKTCLPGFTNNTGADQPAHLRSLIRPFVICVLESIISRLAISDFLTSPSADPKRFVRREGSNFDAFCFLLF